MVVRTTQVSKGRAPIDPARRSGLRVRRAAGDHPALALHEPTAVHLATGCVERFPARVGGAREEIDRERRPSWQRPVAAQAAHSGRETSVQTDHDHGNPEPGRPTRSGAGTGNGNRGASRGSHRCSCSMRVADAVRRGMRTARSPPKRNSLLSQPSPTSINGKCARSGCCSWSKDRTTDVSMVTSAVGFDRVVMRCSRHHRGRFLSHGSHGAHGLGLIRVIRVIVACERGDDRGV